MTLLLYTLIVHYVVIVLYCLYIYRTVSGRISSRSSSVTPKIPAKVSMHNSADLHNTSASSGSHILDQSSLPRHHGNKITGDHPDAQSASSISGSRSLNSPKLERLHSQEDGSPQARVPAMMVREGMDQEDVAMVMQQTQQVAEEQGACSYNFTNILNINTNLDEVEVNENYLNVVGTSHSLSSPSANQNANDNDRSQSQESYLSESYDAEIDQTYSISLPSDLKCSSIDQSDSISLPSDVRGQSIDQSDQSAHSDLSADEMAELETCLQTISNVGCDDLDSLVENVVEPLLSLAKTNTVKTNTVVPESNTVRSEIKISERAIVEGNVTVGEWVNEYKNNIDADIMDDIDSKVSGTVLETPECHHVKENGIVVNITNVDENRKNSLTEGNGIEPSSCILSAVEGKLANAESKENTVSSQVVSNSVAANEDMFEDIPYYLHRRHIVGDIERKKETELYTALINALNHQTAGAEARSRRSRSMKRAPNLQIEQLKADEIPFQPRSVSLPSKRTVSKSPGRRPPGNLELDKSDKTRSRRLRTSHSRSSKSRSPSGNRMIEVIAFHSLPRKDSYSSVDDTATSPTDKTDIFTQFTRNRAISPGFIADSRCESMELHHESYVEPSPVTDISADESFGLTQTASESDSLRGMSDGSISLTHSSFSINESETSQGSYSLSDLNLSRDDIVNEMEKMDSFDGERKTDKIKLEDLDLPFIDAFDESDISENQLSHLQMSNIKQQSENVTEKVEIDRFKEMESRLTSVDRTNNIGNEVGDVGDDRVMSCPYSDVVVTEGVYNFIESGLEIHETHQTNMHYSLHRRDSVDVEERDGIRSETRSPGVMSQTKSPGFRSESRSHVVRSETWSPGFRSETISPVVRSETMSPGVRPETKSPQIKSARPILKPLEIPKKPSWKKIHADDEWESLLQQLKDDENNSPDDLNPADLLLSISNVRSGPARGSPKPRRPLTVEESEIEELDRLLLETTKFNNSERDSDIYSKYSGYCMSAPYRKHDKSYQPHEQSDLNFSTFKPSDSPTRSSSRSSSSRSLLSSRSNSVITVSLSHDVEDIQMEEKPICAYVYQNDQECRLSTSSLSSPHHAIIRRSPSPSRLMEYNSKGHREFMVKGDDSDLDVSKRHSYHGETSQSIDVKEKRKRLEQKRVSFHETVEEITTEAYQSSSSSSDDKSGGDKESDVGTPDTLESGAASDLCYDGDMSSQNAPDDSENDTNESDVGKPYDDENDSEEKESSDEEYSDQDEEFLKFAQSLSECGKDGAADSGIGDSMTNTTEVSPSEPLHHRKHVDDKICENEENFVNENPVIQIDQLDKESLQSFENGGASSSSSDSDLAPAKNDKRPSIDPLESLEQLHDSYVSSSDESSEGETAANVNFSD